MIILIGISFIISRLPDLSNNLIYQRLFIALLIAVLTNFLWTVFSLHRVDLTRSTRSTRKQVGEIFSENFEVANRSFLPKVWVKITDQSELSNRAGSSVLTWIGGHHTRQYIAYSLLEKRGWFRLGPTLIESGDLFGLFLLRKQIDPEQHLLVIPYTVNISNFPAPFGVLPGGRALRQKTLDVTPYSAGVREFVHGDPLKRIHWPTSARKQRLIVKEFEKDPLAEVWIFLDARKDVHIHQDADASETAADRWQLRQKTEFSLPPDTEEYAVSITASIAQYYLRNKREVGLVSVGQNYSILPAERGERQLGKILETLAVLQAEGDMPLWGLISSQITHLARGSSIIIVTPSSDEGILSVVMDLLQRGLMPVVILIDPSSFGAEVDISDLETTLVNRGVLTFVVREGDNLKSVLESAQVHPNVLRIYSHQF
jgi:uncharacterized protein (DUF58 family)